MEFAGPVLIAGKLDGERVGAGRDVQRGGSGGGEGAVEIDFGTRRFRLQSYGGERGVGLRLNGNEFVVFKLEEETGVLPQGGAGGCPSDTRGAKGREHLVGGHAGSEMRCGCASWLLRK